ncbi:molybdenum cofactor biosynthesis protein MoaE [Aeromicrobium phragmitis]|uniref:Molybdenum cofactor biosynthesis protein MoaE n=1 Tax=Aeromicrobium phragmitis TaxID=2478914 RepID=A0A3L8PNR7_9ACTN|nr:molybdenum cofactor biosynthesis protein MoaE [Aeromicrobium phragmitis]RLV56960.1 molybdenum cofactor biosynthesis protein MoaE [Aeromicrobium phragmitis]
MTVELADLRDGDLDLAELVDLVAHESAGAVATFTGVVRNHDGGKQVTRLEYEAHPEAAAYIEASAGRIAARHDGVRVAVVHRTGPLAIGDAAIVAAVAAAHRREAFAAVADLVDDVKATVPIWKHQFYTDGSDDWVNAP